MKTVEEVDLQVRELSRGGNPASRGVLFANKYIQISTHVFNIIKFNVNIEVSWR